MNNVQFLMCMRAESIPVFSDPMAPGKLPPHQIMIVGLLQPTSGTVKEWLGTTFELRPPAFREATSGCIAGYPNLYAKLTGCQTLPFVGDLY